MICSLPALGFVSILAFSAGQQDCPTVINACLPDRQVLPIPHPDLKTSEHALLWMQICKWVLNAYIPRDLARSQWPYIKTPSYVEMCRSQRKSLEKCDFVVITVPVDDKPRSCYDFWWRITKLWSHIWILWTVNCRKCLPFFSQITVLNTVSWMEGFISLFEFHWYLILGA